MRGGVSHGNFSAALGRPTLDWLGCGRHGAHAEDEHIRISTIAPRAALLYDLLVSAVFQNKVVG
jgi:glutamate carboxypeptidase